MAYIPCPMLPTTMEMYERPIHVYDNVNSWPKSPRNNIDDYLQPLIDELNELWVGISAYDTYGIENITMCATLLWTK